MKERAWEVRKENGLHYEPKYKDSTLKPYIIRM